MGKVGGAPAGNQNAISNILKEVAIPLGFKYLPGTPDEKEDWSDDEDEEMELDPSSEQVVSLT